MSETRRDLLILLTLVLATFAVYAQVGGHGFVDIDDEAYVSKNARIQAGLTPENLVWAFTAIHGNNWHPLTTLSHMLDCELFGLAPGPPHLINLLLHMASTALLFLVLRRSTGDAWPSAFVAALFALHPLHVESVAWISERKDALSGLLWMATLLAWVGYVRRPGAGRYVVVLLSLALGLLAKPMLVTLPFALLLWDLWPLRRFEGHDFPNRLGRLVVEKVPLLLMAAAVSVVTFLVQSDQGAVASLEVVPVGARIANALGAYGAYLAQMIWPVKLAVLYPRTQAVAPAVVVASALLLAALTAVALANLRKRPFLPAGWFWYLGTLVPVIGIVQVGSQSRADRYTYIPLIGIFIIVAWGAAELAASRKRLRPAFAAAAALLLAALAAGTWMQVARWKDSFTLFRHALDVTERNYMVHNALGTSLANAGRLDEAVEHFRLVLEGMPEHPDAHYHLGLALVQQGQVDAGIIHLGRVLELEPEHDRAHDHLGYAYGLLGRHAEAREHYLAQMRLKPEDPLAARNLAVVEGRLGNAEEAVRMTARALELARARGQAGLAQQLQVQLDSYEKWLRGQQ